MDMDKCFSLKEGVSLVIVSYNGRKRLKPTLEHLARQRKIDFNFEIIVVDNNSTDSTSQKAKELWEILGNPYELKIAYEATPGTMYARKRGVEESKFRYVLYCDDDNWLNPDYVDKAYKIIRRDPEIAALGGMGIMEYEEGFTPPVWFKPYEKNYGTGPQGAIDGDTTNHKGCLYSAGAIFDKLWLNKLYQLGFTSSLSGRVGKTLLAGEDTELTFALKLIGGKLHYSSELWFKHFMPNERKNWKYLKKLWRSFGYSDFIISPYNDRSEEIEYKKLIKGKFFLLRRIIKLSLQFFMKKPKEGTYQVLERERKIGELLAFIKAFDMYKRNKRQVKQLRAAYERTIG